MPSIAFVRKDGRIETADVPKPFQLILQVEGSRFFLQSMQHPASSAIWAMFYFEGGTQWSPELTKKVSEQLFPAKFEE